MLGSVVLLLAAAGVSAGEVRQPSLVCPEQPLDTPPGVYATTYENEIVLRTRGDVLALEPGDAGFADRARLTCVEPLPEFFRDEPDPMTPAPGATPLTRACGLYAGVAGLSGGGGQSGNPGESGLLEFDRRFAAELTRFVELGYPPTSILIHAASVGLGIDYALYLLTRANPERAADFYDAATAVLPDLPGWTCGTSLAGGGYRDYYTVHELPAERTIEEVARRYFEDNERIEPHPDWTTGDFHLMPDRAEIEALAGETHWYRPGPALAVPGAHPRETVFVALFEDGERILVDPYRTASSKDGSSRAPAVIIYNGDQRIPVGDLEEDVDVGTIVELFFRDGTELAPVPRWQAGDHHFVAELEDVLDLFPIPELAEIPPSRVEVLRARLEREGFRVRPLLISLLDGGGQWLAEPDRVRVALEMGTETAPATVFYHHLERERCAAPGDRCLPRLCDAVMCAGASSEVCTGLPRGQLRRTPVVPPGSEGGAVSPS